jgi:large subunit ribosomal protein L23
MSILGNILKGKQPAGKQPVAHKKEENSKAASESRILGNKPAKLHKRTDINAYRKIYYPLISEKATQLAALNKYVFVVPVSANKSEIVKTVKNVYGVSPKKVNSVRNEGKQVRYGRVKGKKSDFKKVIVTLAAGEKIEIYEGV